MNYYYANMNETENPGYHHEVHKQGCYWGEKTPLENRKPLGYFENEREAVKDAKKYYADADGCAACCPLAHQG